MSVLICLGPGGVGKTTISAALGVAGAQSGARVVVLTIDPARRLADALGVELDNEPRQIEGPWPGELWATMLDVGATFTSLVREHADDNDHAERIIENRLFQSLTTSLSGTNEYMAVERLRSLHLDDRFDVVIVDTPPARHALDFLDSPTRLTRFFDHRLYRTILAPRSGLLRAVNTAAHLAIRAIGKVVGADLLDDVVTFLAAFDGIEDGFRSRAKDVDALLASETARFILVTTARDEPVRATTWIASGLAQRSLKPSVVIANRLTPRAFGADLRLSADSTDPLDTNLQSFHHLATAEAGLVEELAEDVGAQTTVYVDEQSTPVGDLGALQQIAELLAPVISDHSDQRS